MKERPILFSEEMVRAILDGRKMVTRRIVKPQYIDPTWSVRPTHCPRHSRHSHDWWLPSGSQAYAALPHCPYGNPGDRLWVRETWARVGNCDPGYLTYRATYPDCLPADLENVPADLHSVGERWRPSIHMPRSACRILLELVALRVERLNVISEQQAEREGADPIPTAGLQPDELDLLDLLLIDQENPYRPGFAALWESINGPGSWAANPWVWVVEFKRVKP